ncbi:putative protein-S-isoprenylcysteine methyltransferase [Streptococcus sp. DD11]|uniref:methyltransferase family protein n=1 Tax=Streptococcus sp. DD11 TaxID=1777879 RepID=UPI00079A4589|nr:isoprenylcysteine carboxylmethyltransferase family protein [Streptococcus sp. DD11]KXT83399.1 putative protein-S-isoprenylcysteine methyltransferase [Streptococcus sp. DD11]
MDLQTIFIYAFIFIFIGTEMWIKNKTKSNNVSDSADRGSRYIIIGSVICCLLLMNGQLLPSAPHLPSFTVYLGLLLSLAGFALRLYAVSYLGKNFTLAVQTTDQQQLVDHGPYAVVRNPAYTGSILSVLGLSIVSLNPLTIILCLILLVVGYSIRLKVEEKALLNHFGNTYEIYCKKVKYRIFPFIW